MAKLPSLNCPKCNALLESMDYEPNAKGAAPTASDFLSCLRRCDQCGIAFSNSKLHPVRILRDPFDPYAGVPACVSDNVMSALQEPLNETNRCSKLAKLCSFRSEDHVTGTVFCLLGKLRELRTVLAASGIRIAESATAEPALLLWGAPVPPDNSTAKSTRIELVRVLDHIGEGAACRSEPDVIADFGSQGVVFIEVKHLSKNDQKERDHRGWPRYLGGEAFLDAEGVRNAGLYELARNWRIAWDLSTSRKCPMAVLNLGPSNLFTENDGVALRQFQSALHQDGNHRFITISWDALLSRIPCRPLWFDRYLHDRGVGFPI